MFLACKNYSPPWEGIGEVFEFRIELTLNLEP